MDTASLDKGLDKGKKKIDTWSSTVAKNIGSRFAAAFTIGALTSATKKLIQFGSTVSDGATQLRMTTDEWQKFNFAAEMSGTTMANVGTALAQIARTQRDAVDGSDKLRKSYSLLGVSMNTLSSGSRLDVLKAIETTVRSGALSSQQLAAAMDVMGENARMLFPAMEKGFSAFASTLEEIGGLITPEDIASLKELGIEFTKLGFKAIAFGAQLTPLITAFTKLIGFAEALHTALGTPFRFAGALYGGASIGQATSAAFGPDAAIFTGRASSIPQPVSYQPRNISSSGVLNTNAQAALDEMKKALGEQVRELKDINRNTRETASVF